MLIAISESRRPRRNSVRYPVNAGSNMSVAVLIIVYKPVPSAYEQISLLQCARIFEKRKIVFVCPEGLDTQQYCTLCPAADFDHIDPAWQQDIGRFNRLMILPFLYERFGAWEYVLFYQPDAFVFRDELDEWCAKGYDYVGAPWFEGFSSKEGCGDFIGVGNGGFSLRKVQTYLKVLNTFSFITSPRENWDKRRQQQPEPKQWLKHAAGFVLDYTIRNNTHKWFNSYRGQEDQFWGLSVAKKFPWFRVPPYHEAAAFAFEMQPHRLFELNKHQLPFGCHAWWKYDLDFWKPHIEKFGYRL
jgi:hypothetical protein